MIEKDLLKLAYLKLAFRLKSLKDIRLLGEELIEKFGLPEETKIIFSKKVPPWQGYFFPQTYKILLPSQAPDLDLITATLLHELGHAYYYKKYPEIMRVLRKLQSKRGLTGRILGQPLEAVSEFLATRKGLSAAKKYLKYKVPLKNRIALYFYALGRVDPAGGLKARLIESIL
jgi:hypothetical protein